MYTLCCSAKLRERLGTSPAEARGVPNTRLGEWYAVTIGEADLALCVGVEALLPVLVEVKPEASFPQRLARALAAELEGLGVGKAAVKAEAAAMAQWTWAKTTRRSINDAVTDFVRQLEGRLAGGGSDSLAELSLWLAERPCALLGWKSPDEAARELFGLTERRARPVLERPAELPAGAVAWSQGLSIGVDEIDAQHRQLFEIFGALVAAMSAKNAGAEVPRTLDFLGRYVVEHFAAEERCMDAAAYPSRALHRAEHEAFIGQLKRLRAEFRREGPSEGLATGLKEKVRSWLLVHIGRSDRALGEFLRQQGFQVKPEHLAGATYR